MTFREKDGLSIVILSAAKNLFCFLFHFVLAKDDQARMLLVASSSYCLVYSLK